MGTSEAAHEFGALNTLLLVVILGLCILSAYLIKQNSFYYLPESAAAIVVGMIVGGLARVVYPSTEELAFLSFDGELFFFLLLPPIIFEAGYSLEKKSFFANFWTIALYAVFGTIVSTFVIGYLVYLMGEWDVVEIDSSSPMEALVFGALISAVDPVATLSIMGNPELNCEPLLYALVFGESVLNDAVAIVLFKTFMNFYESEEEFSSKTIPSIMVNFTIISLGSVVVGVFIGLVCSYLCKHTRMRSYPEYEISMLFLFAYGSYSFSEALGLSGIMALFFCGIVLSHYNSYNLSPTSQITAHNIFKSLAVLSEFFVFLYIGMGLFTGRYTQINIPFFILCTIFCLIARVFNIFPLSWLANYGRKVSIPWKMQFVMWFAGLRGAIAFALSQNLPGEHRDVYISTTLGIVIFTTIVCGGLTEPMLAKMGMRVQIGAETGTSSVTAGNSSIGHSHDSDDDDCMMAGGPDSPGNSHKSTATTCTGSTDAAGGAGAGAFNSPGGGAPRSMHVSSLIEEAVSARNNATSVLFGLISGATSSTSTMFGNRSPYEHLSMADGGGGGGDDSTGSSGGGRGSRRNQRSFIERFDEEYMQPLFGGPSRDSISVGHDDTDIHIDLSVLPSGGSSISRGDSGSGGSADDQTISTGTNASQLSSSSGAATGVGATPLQRRSNTGGGTGISGDAIDHQSISTSGSSSTSEHV